MIGSRPKKCYIYICGNTTLTVPALLEALLLGRADRAAAVRGSVLHLACDHAHALARVGAQECNDSRSLGLAGGLQAHSRPLANQPRVGCALATATQLCQGPHHVADEQVRAHGALLLGLEVPEALHRALGLLLIVDEVVEVRKLQVGHLRHGYPHTPPVHLGHPSKGYVCSSAIAGPPQE